ncbi:uncharacterized protein JN550_011368 [Neoarthrinium moseri]|uniref:uncharacterized protein n=1 Tax=Neoarthrinium moseri TaxID=1658444 RepID=UPI001FDBC368|nr:uncharacterized protein JN550_011368 [Neoarthrinium moseri]KAI1860767.1 hypothetical protein JN550_011368 [Neoarthrinium moseri]
MDWTRMRMEEDGRWYAYKDWYARKWSDTKSWAYARRRALVIWLVIVLLLLGYLFQFTTVFHPSRLYSISYQEQVARHNSLVSQKIWQILLPMPKKLKSKPVAFAEPSAWMQMNPGYTYTLFGTEGAVAFLQSRFPRRQDYLETFNELRNPGLKSDFLRYMVLYAEGGVYSDLDTRPEKPIDEWVPTDYETVARLVVGIEYDSLGGDIGKDYTYPVQFAQWTIAAAPEHSVFVNMTERCIRGLHELSEKYNTSLGEINSKDDEVLKATGPVAWTETVFEGIQVQAPELQSISDLSGMKEPTLYGDILVLPINGFGSGLPHSGSARWFTPKEALTTHHSESSWRINS